MPIGARVLKTGIAVALSMYICEQANIQPALFAGAATVLNLQPSVSLSLHNAREQIIVHFSSISLAIIIGLILGPHAISMGLATIAVITACNHFGWTKGISTGVMAAIFILGSPPTEFLEHALVRSLAIFIGLAVAMFVNAAIAPPRYHQPLILKLLELNGLVTENFTKAVYSYLYLASFEQEDYTTAKEVISRLFNETQHLYNLYRQDLGLSLDKPLTQKEKEASFYYSYLAYNKGLWQRTKDIIFLAEERQERRKKAGDQPISPEFQEVLTLLEGAFQIFSAQNKELTKKLQGLDYIPGPEPRIWSKMDPILNRWHDTFPSGRYYLHALIEVALITYKIRWAAKESTQLLQDGLL